jgi:hypothetical protein
VVLPAGGANLARVAVTLPGDLAPDVNGLNRACDPAALAAGACPPQARIGTATAASPLAPAPLTGPVLLVGGAFPPPLVIPLTGAVPLTLRAETALPAGVGEGLTNTLGGLPDLPVTRFDLELTGGPTGLLSTLDDLCRSGARTSARAVFTAHSGRVVDTTVPLAVNGCAGGGTATRARPRGTASLRFRGTTGTLRARVLAGRGAPGLKTVRLTLPAGLSATVLARRAAVRLPRVFALGRRLRGGAVRVRGRRLTVRVAGRGGRTVSVTWAGLRAVGSLPRRLSRRPRLTFVARVTEASRRATTLRLRVRPVVSRAP